MPNDPRGFTTPASVVAVKRSPELIEDIPRQAVAAGAMFRQSRHWKLDEAFRDSVKRPTVAPVVLRAQDQLVDRTCDRSIECLCEAYLVGRAARCSVKTRSCPNSVRSEPIISVARLVRLGSPVTPLRSDKHDSSDVVLQKMMYCVRLTSNTRHDQSTYG